MPSAPRWRREPHHLLFPLGAALGVLAVVPFAWRGTGGASLALFHSVAQIQGFLTCFVAGFLLTFVPRETRTAPADGWEVAAAAALPTAAVLSAWVGDALVASWAWLGLLAIVTAFVARRLRPRPAAIPLAPVLLWVPASVVAGAAGQVLVAAGPALGGDRALEAWTVGRGLLVQGFVTGLVLGLGGFLLPRLGGRVPPAGGDGARRRGAALHAAGAVAFFGSFPLELAAGPRAGFGIRAAVAAAVLLGSAGLHRAPAPPGLPLRLAVLAAWLVPAAFLFGALAPRFRGAALHVLFVGGFAQLTLAASTEVVHRRDGAPVRPAWRGGGIAAMAALLAAAFGARIAAALDVGDVATWLEVAAWAFCAAVAAWVAVNGPALFARPRGAPP